MALSRVGLIYQQMGYRYRPYRYWGEYIGIDTRKFNQNEKMIVEGAEIWIWAPF